MSKLCDAFKQICNKQFGFLKASYGLELTNTEQDSYGCYLTFSNNIVAIKVSYEIKDGGVFVMLYRMVDGKMPSYEIFIRRETVINSFDLGDLVGLKEPSVHFEQSFTNPNRPTNKELEANLKQYAEAIKVYAKDILQGDFSCFADLERIVKRRAKVLDE